MTVEYNPNPYDHLQSGLRGIRAALLGTGVPFEHANSMLRTLVYDWTELPVRPRSEKSK